MTITTKFIEGGADLGTKYITKEYMMDVYPELLPQFKAAGLWGWGQGSVGEMGNSVSGSNYSSPIQTIARGANWKSIAIGNNGQTSTGGPSAGIKTDGTLWLWGNGLFGMLGNNASSSVSSPVQTITAGTNWKQVSSGFQHAGAIKTDGTLWLWGYNTYGAIGINDRTHRSSPIQTVAGGTNWKQVSCGYDNTMAIKTDGTLWGWGRNSYYQLATGNNTQYSSPVQTVAGGTNWKYVDCNFVHHAAIKTDGTLWLWGDNAYGALGNGTISAALSSPVQTIAGGTNWKQVSVGYQFTAAIKTDGTLWMWGENSNGQLGTGDITDRSSPTQTVAGGTNWKYVVCNQVAAAAIKTDGTLWMWGRNTEGQLGTTNITHRSSPVQTIAGGTNWKQVAGGGNNFLAIAEFDNW